MEIFLLAFAVFARVWSAFLVGGFGMRDLC